jgi:hypothetical protein
MADRLDVLSARVTALTVIVEGLFTDRLAMNDDPKAIEAIGDAIIKSAFANEAKTRESVSNGDDHAMLITETLSELVDRAVKRAIDRKSRPSP